MRRLMIAAGLAVLIAGAAGCAQREYLDRPHERREEIPENAPDSEATETRSPYSVDQVIPAPTPTPAPRQGTTSGPV